MKVLVTGSSGLIGRYVVKELLDCGHTVVGLDNLSKYMHDDFASFEHSRYELVKGDAKDIDLLKDLLKDCDQFVAGAALVGGIGYFHKYAYDLLAENERITSAAFDAAIWAHRNAGLKKITVISSSMVFERTEAFPSAEKDLCKSPPPESAYGFQKLATEYFARAAYVQYGLPYTIVRPFNCVGIGEGAYRERSDSGVGGGQMHLTHVVPDIICKVLKGQDPLHILGSGKQVRHYTYAGDIARGVRVCLEHPSALNEDFNISTDVSTSVLDLASLVWEKIHRGNNPFAYTSDTPFEHDVQCRIPCVEKAKSILGFEAETPLGDVLDELIPWVKSHVEAGHL